MLLAAVSMFLDLGLVRSFNIDKEVCIMSLTYLRWLVQSRIGSISCKTNFGGNIPSVCGEVSHNVNNRNVDISLARLTDFNGFGTSEKVCASFWYRFYIHIKLYTLPLTHKLTVWQKRYKFLRDSNSGTQQGHDASRHAFVVVCFSVNRDSDETNGQI